MDWALMELQVGFGGGQMHRNDEAARIWTDFTSSVNVPFAYESLRARAYPSRIDEVAVTEFVFPGHDEYRGMEYARIVLGERFPDGGPERSLTLLHESLHLASFVGLLRQMYEVKADVYQLHIADHLPFAFKLADQLFEADAEFALRTQYPERAAARADYYADMQRRAVESRPWVDLHEPTRSYALLGHRLRLELAVLLLAVQDETRAELSARRARVGDELAASNLTPSTRTLINQLEVILSPARDDFSDLAGWGPAAYREVVTRIVSSYPAGILGFDSMVGETGHRVRRGHL